MTVWGFFVLEFFHLLVYLLSTNSKVVTSWPWSHLCTSHSFSSQSHQLRVTQVALTVFYSVREPLLHNLPFYFLLFQTTRADSFRTSGCCVSKSLWGFVEHSDDAPRQTIIHSIHKYTKFKWANSNFNQDSKVCDCSLLRMRNHSKSVILLQ